MKRLTKYGIFGIVLMSIIFLFNPAQAIPVSRLELSAAVIYPGDTFLLDVFVDGVTDDVDLGSGLIVADEVISFGFDADYSPSEFTFNQAVVGTDFEDVSSSFPDTDVAGLAFPGVNGDNILLASLSFTSLVAGDFSLGIVSDLSDPNEGLFALSGIWDITNSTPVSPVPEPAPILLFAVGIAGFGVLGRKKVRNEAPRRKRAGYQN